MILQYYDSQKVRKIDLHLLIAALMDDKGPWLSEERTYDYKVVNVSKRKQLSNVNLRFPICCTGLVKLVYPQGCYLNRNLSKTLGVYNYTQPLLMKTRLQLSLKTLKR